MRLRTPPARIHIFRRKLLDTQPRMKAVLELAAQKAGWTSGRYPQGQRPRHRGVRSVQFLRGASGRGERR